MEEVFANINNFSNYQISNLGNVRNISTNRVLKPTIASDGYYCITLYNEGKAKWFKIHRIVATSFLGNPEAKTEIDHIDRNILNNSVVNLRWATHAENQRNKGRAINNKSGTTGVYQRSGKGLWHAFLCVNGCKVGLGSFKNKDDAINARKQAEIIHYGAFVPIL